MTSYPKVTHSLVNVIIVTLYLGGLVVGDGNAEYSLSEGDGSSHGDHSDGIITPADPYPLVGETVILNCTVKSTYKGPVDVNTMYFTRKDKKPIPNSEVHVLSNDTVQLVWHNVTEDDSGYVFCHTNEDDFLTATDVNVGSLPEKVENVSCIIYNGKSMNCSWCPDIIPRTTTWRPSFAIDHDRYLECFKPTENPMCWCFWPSVDVYKNEKWAYELHMNFEYSLVVEAMNIWSQKRNITISSDFPLDTKTMNKVKPNAVKDLRLTVLNSTSIRVTWERPEKLASSVIVKYQLEYSSEWEKSNISNISGRGLNEPVNYVLDNLHPFTEYNITVRCIPIQGGYWSESRSKNGTTEQAAPSAPPKMYGGGFRIDSVCTASRARDCQVTIMWKGIEKYYQNGIIRFYTVQIRSGENIVVSKNESYNTYQYTYLLYKNEMFSVSVTGTTDAGKSPPSNYIVTISPDLLPKNIVPEIHNETLKIWWDRRNDVKIDNYTIFYCTEGREKGITGCGIGDLESVSVNGDKTYASTSYNQSYLYSMAANSGLQSSGMTNWFCLYHYGAVIPDVDFVFTPEQEQQERSLTIEIRTKLSCKDQTPTGRILYYTISVFCANSSQSCDEENTTRIAIERRSHVIGNLKPNTDYVVRVTGFGNTSNKSQSRTHRTKESPPAKPPVNVTIEPVSCRVLLVTWSPPPKEDWNGKTLSYTVKYKKTGDSPDLEHSKTTPNTSLNITEIYGYTNYTISVTAVTSGGPSEPSISKVTQTDVCEPSGPTIQKVDILNSSQVEMRWSAPKHANGPIKSYKVYASYRTSSGAPANQSWNTTGDKKGDKFTMICPDDIKEHLLVNYTITAVTQDPATRENFEGPPSPEVTKPMCKPGPAYNTSLVFAVGVPIAVVIIIVVIVVVCRQKYSEFKHWIRGGKPEEPPVIPDLEKPDDLTSISTDPAYIDDWVQNLLVYVDSTPLIDDNNKDIKDDYSEYRMDSGGSVGSRIIIEGWKTEKTSSGTYDEAEAPTSNAEETEHIYKKAQPDTLDETMGLVNSDFSSPVITEDVSDNPEIGLQNQAYEGQSDSSGIHSDKTSDSDSKNSSCASSGIGPEAAPCNKAPLGSLGLFAFLTSDDLNSDSDDEGYKVTRKRNYRFEEMSGQEDANDNSADSCVNSELYSNGSLPQKRWVETDEKENSPDIERQLNVCTTCRKRHEPNIKCGLTSPELRAHQSDRVKRLDSSCSDESIPMGMLNSTNDFSVDTSPCINSKVQLPPHLLTLNSNATSC